MIHHENIIIMFITGGEKSSLNQDSNPGLKPRTQTQDLNSGLKPRTRTQGLKPNPGLEPNFTG